MSISVGGIEWKFSVQYAGANQLKAASGDMQRLKEATERVDVAKANLIKQTERLNKVQSDAESSSKQIAFAIQNQSRAFEGLKESLEDAAQAYKVANSSANELRTTLATLNDPMMAKLSAASDPRASADVMMLRLGMAAKSAATEVSSVSEMMQRLATAAKSPGMDTQMLALANAARQASSAIQSIPKQPGGYTLGGSATTGFGTRGYTPYGSGGRIEYPSGPTTTYRDPSYSLGGSPTAGTASDARYHVLASAAARAETSVTSLTTAIEKDKKVQREKGVVNRELSQSFTNLGQNLQLVQHYLIAVGTALGANNLYQFLHDVTILAGRVDTLGIVLDNVGSISGYTRGTLANLENQVKSLGITTQAARQSMVLLAQGEIDLSNAAKLSRIAQDAAVIAGINSSEAFERLVVAIQRTNTWMLRNLGIMINLHNVYREYAVESGRVSTTLSTHEKQQLLLNEVLKKGVLIQGSYESAMESVHKQYTSLDRVIEETKRSLGEELQPIFKDMVATSNYLLNSFQKLDDNTKAMVAAMLIGVTAAFALTTALTALAGAIVLVRLAAGDMTAALSIGAVALAALGTGYFSYGKMLSGHFIKDMKDAAREGSALAAANHSLADSYSTLREAEEIRRKNGELTIEQLRTIDNEVLNIAAHIPQMTSQFRAMDSKMPGDIADALAKANAMVQGSPELQAEFYESKLAHIRGSIEQLAPELEAASDLVEQRKKHLRESSSTGGNRDDFYQLNRLWQKLDNSAGEMLTGKAISPESKLAELQAQHNALLVEEEKFVNAKKELNLLSNAEIARDYENMVKQQETAHNLALRVLKQFNDDKTNLFKDSNVKIFQEYKSTLENLSRQFMTEEQIKKGVSSSLEVRLEEFRNKRDEMIQVARDRNVGGSLSDEELDKVKRNAAAIFAAQEAEVKRAAVSEEQHQLKVREDILKTFEVAKKRVELERQMREVERNQQAEYTKQIADGEDERIARLNRELTVLKMITEETVKQRNLEGGELRGQEKELMGKISGLVGPNSAKERAILEAQLQTVRDVIKANEDAILDVEKDAKIKSGELERERMEVRKKIREKYVEDVKRLEEQLHDTEIKLHNHLVDMEEKRDAERLRRAKEVLSVEKDILDEQEKSLKELSKKFHDQFDERVKAIEMQREFGRLLGQGATPGQAMAMVAEKFKIAPVGVQLFDRAVKAKQAEIDAAQKANAEKVKQLEKDAALAHQAKVEASMAKAETTRGEIQKDIAKIKELLTKEKAEKDKAEARGKGEVVEGDFRDRALAGMKKKTEEERAKRAPAEEAKSLGEEAEKRKGAIMSMDMAIGDAEKDIAGATNNDDLQEAIRRRDNAKAIKERKQKELADIEAKKRLKDEDLKVPEIGPLLDLEPPKERKPLLNDLPKSKDMMLEIPQAAKKAATAQEAATEAIIKAAQEGVKASEKAFKGAIKGKKQAEKVEQDFKTAEADYERAFSSSGLT